jgi:hypothetical protein
VERLATKVYPKTTTIHKKEDKLQETCYPKQKETDFPLSVAARLKLAAAAFGNVALSIYHLFT